MKDINWLHIGVEFCGSFALEFVSAAVRCHSLIQTNVLGTCPSPSFSTGWLYERKARTPWRLTRILAAGTQAVMASSYTGSQLSVSLGIGLALAVVTYCDLLPPSPQ